MSEFLFLIFSFFGQKCHDLRVFLGQNHPVIENHFVSFSIILSDGLVGTHRLLLAAVSPLARLVLGGDLEDHLVLPGVKVAEVRELMEGLCSGRLEKSPDLLPLLNMLCIVGEAEECEDMDGEGDESYLEPVLHMNIGEAMSGEGGGHHPLLQDHQDGCFSSDYDNLASDAEIEAKALELKEKIFAECGMVSRRKKQMRNTRNPSKIWKWFTKTPDYIYCKVCGLGIKNSGNTTNASSHLKRHPRQYAEFKMEVIQQPLLLEESIREEVICGKICSLRQSIYSCSGGRRGESISVLPHLQKVQPEINVGKLS